MGKRKNKNRNTARKRKNKHEMRINVRQIDELIEQSKIEDETWDAVVYKDLNCFKLPEKELSYYDLFMSYIYKSSTINKSDSSESNSSDK
jgi:hypothetical protein